MTATCTYGHEMSGDNVYRWKNREFCRACHAARQLAYRRETRKGLPTRQNKTVADDYDRDDYTPRHAAVNYVYFIGDGVGHVKIGVATDIDSRLRVLQCGNAHALTVLTIEEGGYDLERAYHARFAAHRVRSSNEWFFMVPEIEDWIDHLRRLI